MKRVFIDTSGFFAALVSTDQHHEHAASVFRRADSEGWKLVTSTPVVYETHALLLARAPTRREAGLAFLDAVATDSFNVERPSARDEERARAIIRSYADKAFSFCDAVSFAMLDRLRIREVLSFDQHFKEYGRLILL